MNRLPAVLAVLLLATPAAADTDNLDFASLLQSVDDSNKLYDSENWYNWGSSIVKGEDGRYHLFYSQMSRELGFLTWLTDGVISRAVSDSPAGPYVHEEIVLRGRGTGHWDERTAHNPWIQKHGGKFYLYYMSTNFGGQEVTDEQLHRARTEWIDDEYRAMIRESQRIGVAVADGVHGPWTRLDDPIIEPGGPIETITCNPAVSQRPDGGFIMLVRGDMPGIEELVRHQAIAFAPTPTGPWEVQEQAAVDKLNAEDPALWWDETRQRYYGIYHAFGYMGLITSEDGLNWRRANNYKIMGLAYRHKNGEMIEVARMERPFVFLEDGQPTVLTVSIRQHDGETYSMFIPLRNSLPDVDLDDENSPIAELMPDLSDNSMRVE